MKNSPCTKLRFCRTLAGCFTEPNRAGINPVLVATLGGKIRTAGVAFKRTQKDQGIFLNLCPFCGVNIAPVSRTAAKESKP